MKLTRNVLAQIQKRVDALRPRQPEDEHDAEVSQLLDDWEAGGCQGPLPPAGPCPAKYKEVEWLEIHRLLCGMILQGHGLPLPDDFTAQERAEIEMSRVFFESFDPQEELSPRARGVLARFRNAIETFGYDPGGGVVPGSRPQEATANRVEVEDRIEPPVPAATTTSATKPIIWKT